MKTKPENKTDQIFLMALAQDILKTEHSKKTIELEFVDVRYGTCEEKTDFHCRITIPLWAKTRRTESYLYSYLIHEVTHVIVGGCHMHDRYFKAKETKLLKEYMGITQVHYSRAYVKKLIRNGQVIYDRGY